MASTLFPAKNFKDYVFRLSPTWYRAFWGERVLGGSLGHVFDLISEGLTIALHVPWLASGKSPPDALPLLGEERLMRRYPVDTDLSYRRRLFRAWRAWPAAGTKAGIIGQLNEAGYDNVTIQTVLDGWAFELPIDTANWSRFAVIIEPPTSLVCNPHVYGGGDSYGDPGLTYGVIGQPDLQTIKAIIRQWKLASAINPCFFVVESGEYYGDPTLTYGGGAVYGGTSCKVDHQV